MRKVTKVQKTPPTLFWEKCHNGAFAVSNQHHYDFSPEQTWSTFMTFLLLSQNRTIMTFLQNRHAAPLWLFSKDQENPNFWAFDTLGSLTNNPVFEPGRLGKYLGGTEISKFWPKLKILVDASIAMSIRIITTIQKALKPCKKKDHGARTLKE